MFSGSIFISLPIIFDSLSHNNFVESKGQGYSPLFFKIISILVSSVPSYIYDDKDIIFVISYEY